MRQARGLSSYKYPNNYDKVVSGGVTAPSLFVGLAVVSF